MMNKIEYNDDRLNMFIDGQLDTEEMNSIREAMLDDAKLRDRICQLKAVRELVGFAYQSVPRSRWDRRKTKPAQSVFWKGIAASFILGLGALLGWQSAVYVNTTGETISVASAFDFFSYHEADRHERKFLVHISTDDVVRVDSALKEINTLIASYRTSNTPLKVDIVTNMTGINVLRTDVSPYIATIGNMVNEHHVNIYACERAITHLEAQEGVRLILMPEAVTDRAARDIIPERLEQGWVYIKV